MASLEPIVDSTSSETHREGNQRKRRKIGHESSNGHKPLAPFPWRSETEQRIYSSKLVEALRRVLRQSPSSAAKPRLGRDVREIADRVLAVTAKGRTRWSRAILASPLSRRKFHRQHKKVKKGVNGLKKPEVSRERRRLPTVQRKARVLSRLVPGCRKASLPSLLEETTDYISALEMQVRAMTALTELLGCGTPADRLGRPRP
ncbi:transcription factor bHLH147-like [Prosopis cineraria]|uniref:transcription factor bHLH147-like n=1 Tax=Prosopis cineraria TaxID=364024 RepID=UPI00240F54DA|nr:transcription factor bHLH147-like [Prosopis cineraria]